MSRARAREAIAWTAVASALAVVGALLLATRFMVYDDEGYVLWSVRSYLSGHALYDEVFSQYGPLFFLGYRVLCAITGLVLDSDSARILTLVYWVGASLLAGACARLLLGALLPALAAAALAFLVLISNSSEPFHPGSLLALLTAVFAWWGIRAILREREPAFVPFAAVLAGCAALIKINVGGLMFIALGSWLAFNGAARARLSLRGAFGLCVSLTLIPLALMSRHLDQEDFRRYAGVVAGAVAGLSLLLWRARRETFPPRSWAVLFGVPAGLGAVVFGFLLADGSSPMALLEGILLGPLRHPGVYTFAPDFSKLAVPAVAACLALLVLAPRFRQGEAGVAVLRIAGALWFLWECLDPLTGRAPDRFAFYHGPALAILFSLPPRDRPLENRDLAALWLAWVYLWQTLHAYPVSGSQVAWGSFLWVPLAVYGLHRGMEYFRLLSRLRPSLPIPHLLLGGTAAIGVMRLAALAIGWWHDGASLDFPAARRLRPSPTQADEIRTVHRNLLHHADTVFSLPGMFSFNVWTGLPTPTHANVTHWFNLLNETRQREIIDALETSERPAIVVMPFLLEYLAKHDVPVGGPLFDYLKSDFRPAIDAGQYELWFPRERTPPTGVDSFIITHRGLEACTKPLPAPVHSAILRDQAKRSRPKGTPSLPPAIDTPPARDEETAPGRAVELQQSPDRPWRSEPAPGEFGLERHRLPITPPQGPRFSDQLLLDLMDGDGQVMATCRFDRIRQAINDAAPPAAN